MPFRSDSTQSVRTVAAGLVWPARVASLINFCVLRNIGFHYSDCLQGLELKLSSGSIAGLADMFQESLHAHKNNNGGTTSGGVPSKSNGKAIESEGAFDDLPFSVRVLLYDIKVRGVICSRDWISRRENNLGTFTPEDRS